MIIYRFGYDTYAENFYKFLHAVFEGLILLNLVNSVFDAMKIYSSLIMFLSVQKKWKSLSYISKIKFTKMVILICTFKFTFFVKYYK